MAAASGAAPVYVALDTTDLAQAKAWAAAVAPHAAGVKLGLETSICTVSTNMICPVRLGEAWLVGCIYTFVPRMALSTKNLSSDRRTQDMSWEGFPCASPIHRSWPLN